MIHFIYPFIFPCISFLPIDIYGDIKNEVKYLDGSELWNLTTQTQATCNSHPLLFPHGPYDWWLHTTYC